MPGEFARVAPVGRPHVVRHLPPSGVKLALLHDSQEQLFERRRRVIDDTSSPPWR